MDYEQRDMTITIQQVTPNSVMYTMGQNGAQIFRYAIPRNKPQLNELIDSLKPGSTYTISTVRLPSTWMWTKATSVGKQKSPIRLKLEELVKSSSELSKRIDLNCALVDDLWQLLE